MPCQAAGCPIEPPHKSVETIRDPTPAAVVRRVVNRAPTPLPDVVERVHIKREPQTVIENVLEQPRKPPPRVVERVEVEAAPPSVVNNSCIYVDPRPKAHPAAATYVHPSEAYPSYIHPFYHHYFGYVPFHPHFPYFHHSVYGYEYPPSVATTPSPVLSIYLFTS
jgi:hypothetical protein